MKHDRSKDQKVLLSKLMIDFADEMEDVMAKELSPGDLDTVTHWKNKGRRDQDKKNLSSEIMYENQRSSRLTRRQLTIEWVQTKATVTKPTNDATFEFNATVLFWREKVNTMCSWTFWNNVKPNNEYRKLWQLLRKSFIHIDCILFFETSKKTLANGKSKKVMKILPRKYEWHGHIIDPEKWDGQVPNKGLACYNWGASGCSLYERGSIYNIITSKTRAGEFAKQYIATAKSLSSYIYSFLRYEDQGKGFSNKSVKKEDLRFLFIRYVEEAWGDDVIEPAVDAAFNTSRYVDPHFKYTLETNEEDIELDDDASENKDDASEEDEEDSDEEDEEDEDQ